MASVRTTRHCLSVLICQWIAVFLLLSPAGRSAAQQPRLCPDNSSVICWGELPPIPTDVSTNMTRGSRPGTLASMAQGFVDMVQPSGLPISYITKTLNLTLNGDSSQYYLDNWRTETVEIMGEFVGIFVCLCIGLLFILVMPFTALFFCCCRCCDNCGGKRVQRESKSMGCKRVTLSLIFFSITGIICAGMAFTNVSNEFIKTSVNEFKTTADTSLGNLVLYFDGANDQIDYMVATEYVFVDSLLRDNLNNIGTEIGVPVQEYLNNEAGLGEVESGIANISNILSEMERTLVQTSSLQAKLVNQSSVLEDELDQVAASLNASNHSCGSCMPDTDGLRVTANYSQLPSLDAQIEGVQEAVNITISISTEIDAVLDDIPDQITNMTEDTVSDTIAQLDDASKNVNSSFRDISEVLSDISSEVSNAKQSLDDAWEDPALVYTQYLYYGLIGLTCTVLLIVMFNVIGITMGTFSYKNVSPTERSRMSNAGGNVLMAGVFFTFLLAPFLMIITCVLFTPLSVVTLTCAPLLSYELLNQTVDQPNVIVDGYYFGDLILQNSSVPLTSSGILTECNEGASAYSALMLDSLYNFDSIAELLKELESEVQKLVDEIVPGDITYDFPFDQFIDQLTNLTKVTELGQVNYTEFEVLLAADITGVNLTEYAEQLRNISSVDLTVEANELDRIQAEIVDPMQVEVAQIQNNLMMLQTLEVQLDQEINRTIMAIGIAEGALSGNATSDAIVGISVEYAERLLGYADQFYLKIEDQVTSEFAQCQILSSLYAYAVQSSCDYSIASVNTLWFTVGWCVFFYVPSIIFAVKLAKYYRIMDEEAPYRAPKKSKKKKQQRRQRESDEEVALDDIEVPAGTEDVRLVDNGRPHSMMAQQNPHYVQDEPILAYNDLGRPMAPPPAYNPGYPKNVPPTLPPIENPHHQYYPQGSAYYNGTPRGPSYHGGPGYHGGPSRNAPQRQSMDMYQYNTKYKQAF